MGIFSPYTYKNKQKRKYWIHSREHGTGKLYFFSSDPVGALYSLPKGFQVVENPVTGLPFLKKKTKKGLFAMIKSKGEKKPSPEEKGSAKEEKPVTPSGNPT